MTYKKSFKKKTKANYPQNPKGSPFLEQQGHMTHSSQVTSVPKEIGALFMGMIEIGRRHAAAVTKFVFWKLLPWGFHENSLMIQCLKNECPPVKKHAKFSKHLKQGFSSWFQHLGPLTLNTLTSVCIFTIILLSVHFLSCRQGEFV